MDLDASTKFIGSLTKFLQSLCNGYVEFQKGVELVGHIYLSIDTGEKVDYVLHEKVNKSDENSVTFVSNSFHAMPPDKEKGKSEPSKANAVSKNINNISDDDDIVILDSGASRSSIGSTNSGTIPSRKRSGSPDQRQMHKHVKTAAGQSSIGRGVGSSRHHSGVPSATVSSQGLDINELKLEQISNDELLSLASQVGEGHSRPSVPRSQARRSGASAVGGAGDATAWIKQEAPDNPGGDADSGWSQGRDESNSNSGSNLYPVMLHTNTAAAYSNPPVFPGTSFANPMPGTSQDVSGLDPSVSVADWKRREYWRQYRLRQKMDPVRYQRIRDQARERKRRQVERQKQRFAHLDPGVEEDPLRERDPSMERLLEHQHVRSEMPEVIEPRQHELEDEETVGLGRQLLGPKAEQPRNPQSEEMQRSWYSERHSQSQPVFPEKEKIETDNT